MAKDRIESKYVTVAPGVELHILEKGEGKPLVFIPGLTFSGEIFKNQLEYFSSEYRVIAIDPRGQGYSAKTVDGNDYLTHGRDVAGLIDALGLKDIVLIGWSTGNLDTWSYVQQFGKDKLRGVVTIDMSPLPLSPDPKWWTEGTIEELSQVATQVLTSSQGCREFFSEYATGVMIQHKMNHFVFFIIHAAIIGPAKLMPTPSTICATAFVIPNFSKTDLIGAANNVCM